MDVLNENGLLDANSVAQFNKVVTVFRHASSAIGLFPRVYLNISCNTVYRAHRRLDACTSG